jgi:hypothetical protein
MAGMVRLGGIAAFIGALAFGLNVALRDGNVYLEMSTGQVVSIISKLVGIGCLVMALWATKTLFNAHGYRRADLTILGSTALLMLWLAYGFANLADWSYNPYSTSGIVGDIINIVPLIAALALSLLFGIQALGFASRGGGIWKAIGILYLVATGLVVLWAAFFFVLTLLMGLEFWGGTKFAFSWSLAFGPWPICVAMIVALAVHGVGLLRSERASRGRVDGNPSGPLARPA